MASTVAVDVPSRYADRKWNGRPSAALGLDSVHAECTSVLKQSTL